MLNLSRENVDFDQGGLASLKGEAVTREREQSLERGRPSVESVRGLSAS
jgi:hypothetical protein